MIKALLLATIFIASNLLSYDTPLFYRARFFNGEPRFEKPGLISNDIIVAGGKTSHARNNKKDRTCLLDREQATIFSKTGRIKSKFSFFEAGLESYINATDGFFWHSYIPYRVIQLNDIALIDSNCSKKNLALAEFPKKVRSSFGDISTLAGWAVNYEETCYLDFIDFNVESGIIWPCSKNSCTILSHDDSEVLIDIPIGYNGHFGFPILTKLAFGAYEWLTIGTYLNVILFADHKKKFPEHMSPLWSSGLYCKADHFIKGLSLLLGYAYDHKQSDCLSKEKNALLFPYTPWTAHTFHFFLDYDFSSAEKKYGSRVALFCNKILTGKNIFLTPSCGGQLGIDISLFF